MKYLYLVCLVATALSFHNCTIHNGQVISLDYGNPVSPQNKARGESSATYFFGIGGRRTNLILEEAKDNLVMNRPLEVDESYANVNLNISTSYFLFFNKTKYILTADVVPDADYKNTQIPILTSNFYNLGDTIISNQNDILGTYNGKISKSAMQVLKRFKGGDIKLVKVNIDNVFKNSGSYKGFSIGQTVTLYRTDSDSGVLVGLSEDHALIMGKYGEFTVIAYENIDVK
jgi:hypothetical protein